MHRHRTYSRFFFFICLLSFIFFPVLFSSRRVPVYSNGDVVIFSSSVEFLFKIQEKENIEKKNCSSYARMFAFFFSFVFTCHGCLCVRMFFCSQLRKICFVVLIFLRRTIFTHIVARLIFFFFRSHHKSLMSSIGEKNERGMCIVYSLFLSFDCQ